MAGKYFELIIKYNNWDISIFDNEDNLLTELKCKANWLSNYYSGNANINGSIFSIVPDKNGIILKENSIKIGEVKITTQGQFGYIANIDIREKLYTFKRENLKEKFTVVSENINFIIEGRINKEKQKNFFGLVYFDDKLYYSVFMADYLANKLETLQILVVCGYCIRLFQSLRMGE